MLPLRSHTPTPEQLTILDDSQPGFRLIKGAAGSGKTTTALLRLSQLRGARISRKSRLGIDRPVRILVLTFNRTLRGYIRELAEEQGRPTADVDLTVDTFGHWAWDLVGRPEVLRSDHERSRLCQLLTNASVCPENLDYLVDEIRYIVGKFERDKRDAYLNIIRVGRGRSPAVTKELRQTLLNNVIEPFETQKRRNGELDWNDVALCASQVPNQRYDVVIADECQDFSANQIRAILAHLDEDHSTTFIVDTAQRIYPQVFNWSETGIQIQPRMVYSLTRNYRNTAKIARLARSLLQGLPDDPDRVVPDPEICVVEGTTPQVLEGVYRNQMEWMLDKIEPCLADGDTVAFLQMRGRGWFDYLKRALAQRSTSYCEITQTREWPRGSEQVALSTIHSAKGLEFDHVLMPGLNSEVTPHGSDEGDGTLDSLRRLVAMGIGRARKTVTLGYKPEDKSKVLDFVDPACFDLIRV